MAPVELKPSLAVQFNIPLVPIFIFFEIRAIAPGAIVFHIIPPTFPLAQLEDPSP